MTKGPLFQRTSGSDNSSGPTLGAGDYRQDIPADWQTEIDNYTLAAFDFGGSLDALMDGTPIIEVPGSPIPTNFMEVDVTHTAPGGLLSPGITSPFSSCSSQVISDDNDSVDGRDFALSPKPCSPYPVNSLRVTPQALAPPKETSSGCTAASCVANEKEAMHTEGWIRGGRPEGKFPLHPEGRCDHQEHWHRLRARRNYSYFFCKYCGLGWCSPKIPKEVSSTEVPNPIS